MADDTGERTPACFGRLEQVFPVGPSGLRESPPRCLRCEAKTECLRRTVSGEEGLAVHEERLERAYRTGGVGFLERWAAQKRLAGQKRKGSRWTGLWNRLRRSGPSGRD